MKLLELLAPAKDLESGIAAINYGADAVYIGAEKFGARAAVGNSIQDIEAFINYAHKFNVKVYITINTVLFDNELTEVEHLINKLYNISADAIIIQDLGILEMNLPPIPIFASTQTNNYSLDRIKFLECIGISRIILARELSLKQIKEISDNTIVELESFIHGALCVSYSGQCYFGEAVYGRSANRGICAQPCRMQYTLEDDKGKIYVKDKYLLSLKDLNLTSSLGELVKGGVTSFKIEGRLKDINYIKNITAHYRKILDEIIEQNPAFRKSSSGKINIDFTPEPSKTFNRGYTNYFVDGKNNNLASFNTQKSIGEFVGKINHIEKKFITIDSNKSFHNGDGICFLNKKDELTGTKINIVDGNRLFIQSLENVFIGAEVFRNADTAFENILNSSKTHRKISLRIELIIWKEALKVITVDEDNHQYEKIFSVIGEAAENKSKMLDTIKKQFIKSGDSIFDIKLNLKIENDIIPFVPFSKLNEIRRKVFADCEQLRLKKYKKAIKQIVPNEVEYYQNKLNYKHNVTNKLSEQFYKRHKSDVVEKGFEKDKNVEDLTIMTCKYCIKKELDICPLDKGKNAVQNDVPLYLKDAKNTFRLVFDCAKCEMSVKLK
ncbi:MAG TPA: U32 family peptidase [Ignavibacteriaceae bacterium]|nr:U32 family peptidase [Ignavibacteriaceae bacterium]